MGDYRRDEQDEPRRHPPLPQVMPALQRFTAHGSHAVLSSLCILHRSFCRGRDARTILSRRGISEHGALEGVGRRSYRGCNSRRRRRRAC